MEISVKITSILPVQTYTKRDNTQGSRFGFIGETMVGQYTHKIKFDVMSGELWAKMNLLVGSSYNVSFDLESREWNGKWFTSVNAWRAYLVTAANEGEQANNTQNSQATVNQNSANAQAKAQAPQNVQASQVQTQSRGMSDEGELPF